MKQLPRPCTSDFESFFNGTRNFGGKYRKSAVNNFLEKKRINNLDEDSIEYVKGDFACPAKCRLHGQGKHAARENNGRFSPNR